MATRAQVELIRKHMGSLGIAVSGDDMRASLNTGAAKLAELLNTGAAENEKIIFDPAQGYTPEFGAQLLERVEAFKQGTVYKEFNTIKGYPIPDLAKRSMMSALIAGNDVIADNADTPKPQIPSAIRQDPFKLLAIVDEAPALIEAANEVAENPTVEVEATAGPTVLTPTEVEEVKIEDVVAAVAPAEDVAVQDTAVVEAVRTEEEIDPFSSPEAASNYIERVLGELYNAGAINNMPEPGKADFEFDENSQKALHAVLSTVKTGLYLEGKAFDGALDGTYTEKTGQELTAAIDSLSPEKKAEFLGQVGGEEQFKLIIRSLDTLSRERLLNNTEGKKNSNDQLKMITAALDFLPGVRPWLEGLANTDIGKFIVGLIEQFTGIPLSKVLGLEGADLPQAQRMANLYNNAFAEANGNQAELDKKVLDGMKVAKFFSSAEEKEAALTQTKGALMAATNAQLAGTDPGQAFAAHILTKTADHRQQYDRRDLANPEENVPGGTVVPDSTQDSNAALKETRLEMIIDGENRIDLSADIEKIAKQYNDALATTGGDIDMLNDVMMESTDKFYEILSSMPGASDQAGTAVAVRAAMNVALEDAEKARDAGDDPGHVFATSLLEKFMPEGSSIKITIEELPEGAPDIKEEFGQAHSAQAEEEPDLSALQRLPQNSDAAQAAPAAPEKTIFDMVGDTSHRYFHNIEGDDDFKSARAARHAHVEDLYQQYSGGKPMLLNDGQIQIIVSHDKEGLKIEEVTGEKIKDRDYRQYIKLNPGELDIAHPAYRSREAVDNNNQPIGRPAAYGPPLSVRDLYLLRDKELAVLKQADPQHLDFVGGYRNYPMQPGKVDVMLVSRAEMRKLGFEADAIVTRADGRGGVEHRFLTNEQMGGRTLPEFLGIRRPSDMRIIEMGKGVVQSDSFYNRVNHVNTRVPQNMQYDPRRDGGQYYSQGFGRGGYDDPSNPYSVANGAPAAVQIEHALNRQRLGRELVALEEGRRYSGDHLARIAARSVDGTMNKDFAKAGARDINDLRYRAFTGFDSYSRSFNDSVNYGPNATFRANAFETTNFRTLNVGRFYAGQEIDSHVPQGLREWTRPYITGPLSYPGMGASIPAGELIGGILGIRH